MSFLSSLHVNRLTPSKVTSTSSVVTPRPSHLATASSPTTWTKFFIKPDGLEGSDKPLSLRQDRLRRGFQGAADRVVEHGVRCERWGPDRRVHAALSLNALWNAARSGPTLTPISPLTWCIGAMWRRLMFDHGPFYSGLAGRLSPLVA
ncbi:MAG: hypothetical protein MI723_09390, partial [Caulobacterales bacterium]|nr:hypothetical protein [Caulobacterales bacterium]